MDEYESVRETDEIEPDDCLQEEWLSWEKHQYEDVGITRETSLDKSSNSGNSKTEKPSSFELLVSDDNEEHQLTGEFCSQSQVERMSLNDQKAGMEGLDKDRINKIIHEASKGSKFYENERRKEEKTKERIKAMKSELEKYTKDDRSKALLEADRVLNKLRQQNDLSRTIVHIDMDAFYAAVEMRDDPKLRDVPMAVGGNSMLSTSNYLARKYGVRAAMPGFIAKKLCPKLVIVPTHFDKYRKVSSEIREIFSEYDSNFLPLSLDEAYLDLTEYIEVNFFRYPDVEGQELVEVIVNEIRTKIYEKTSLTASAGIASNTMLAKICSDLNKPNGQYFLKSDFNVIANFLEELPIRKVKGIGKLSAQMLSMLGIVKCGDLYNKRDLLYLLFSSTSFLYFMDIHLGIGSNRLEHGERKSLSAERTFSNEGSKERLLKICYSICEDVSEDLTKHNLQGKTVTLKYKLSNFITKTRAKTLPYPVHKTGEIYTISKEILLNEIKGYKPQKEFELRLMGVRVSQFVEGDGRKQNTIDQFLKGKGGLDDNYNETGNRYIIDVARGKETLQFIENESKNTGGDKNYTKREGSLHTSKVPCPICGNLQERDMTVLNSHIDNCLTKQTIKNILEEQSLSSHVSNTLEQGPKYSNVSKHNAKKANKRKSTEDHKCSKKATLLSLWKK